ncbi:MAG: N-acetylmuramoyl-L-alanine amidase [Bacteroidales bacterium]|nr:N-acetylmuramoyl-L-alanine amidase [Bacteroidales bacterium]
MKRIFLIFGIFCLFVLFSNFAISQKNNRISKVVIDAGHGGRDPGALGKLSKEKDITLSIALKTGNYIKENFNDVEVIYTRDKDKFVELHKRVKIANDSKADLFISIHCNSNPSRQPYGSETYIMGLHKTQENLEVAKAENAAILIEDDYSTQYEGFDPNSDEDYIALSLFQSANIDQSLDISSKVQKQFKERVGRRDRGVKQAGFWVLYKTTMPGILIETGFLSNTTEEKFLMSEQGQVFMASAIYRAFKEYKKEFEDTNKELKPIVKVQDEKKEEELPKPEIVFRVQFASFKKEKPLDSRKFKDIQNIRVYEHKGLFKYTTGNEKTFEEAKKLKSAMRKNGFKDVFIVAFADDKRITVEEAKNMIKE